MGTIRARLQATHADDVLGSWATIRRGRCEELLGGPNAQAGEASRNELGA